MKIAGIILAGGKSTRFGRQKIFEKYDNIPFYKHSVNAFLQSGLKDAYIITNHELAPFFQGENVIEEAYPHQGPLSALTCGLQALYNRFDWFFVLPADSPFVSVSFVEDMIGVAQSAGDTYDMFLPVSGDRWQPLHSLYHARALTKAEEIIAHGKQSMVPLIHSLRVKEIMFPEEKSDFTNINRPEDLRKPPIDPK